MRSSPAIRITPTVIIIISLNKRKKTTVIAMLSIKRKFENIEKYRAVDVVLHRC
jgi:hypothetical protein